MKKVILLTVFTLLFSLGFSFAEVPCKINYQGRLIKDGVPVNASVNMEFKLYTQLTGGTPIKTITLSSVPVYNGLFRAVLDLEGIDWTAGQTIYLEVKVGTDVLSPREEIYAYPYAINTRFLDGKAKDYFINTSAEIQTKQGGLNIMGPVGIGITTPGAKLHIGGTPGTDGIMFPDGSLQTTANSSGTANSFGTWTSKDSSGNTLVKNTVYRVTSDGFITAYTTDYWEGFDFLSDASNPPTVTRMRVLGGHGNDRMGGMCPVRKDDYFRVVRANGNAIIQWLPIGSGSCVKQ